MLFLIIEGKCDFFFFLIIPEHTRFLLFVPPFSAVSCGIPESPGNGSVMGNEFSLGSRVIYECKEGFKLETSQQATAVCQEDELWSNKGRPPVCKRKCAYISQAYFS